MLSVNYANYRQSILAGTRGFNKRLRCYFFLCRKKEYSVKYRLQEPIRFQKKFKLSPFALLLGALFADRTGAVLAAEIGGHTEVPNRQDVQREAGGKQHADRGEEICYERLAICERECVC